MIFDGPSIDIHQKRLQIFVCIFSFTFGIQFKISLSILNKQLFFILQSMCHNCFLFRFRSNMFYVQMSWTLFTKNTLKTYQKSLIVQYIPCRVAFIACNRPIMISSAHNVSLFTFLKLFIARQCIFIQTTNFFLSHISQTHTLNPINCHFECLFFLVQRNVFLDFFFIRRNVFIRFFLIQIKTLSFSKDML